MLTRTQLAAVGFIFACGFGTGLVAQPITDIPQRVEHKRTDLTGTPGMEVISSLVEIKPGESTEMHFHHGVEAAHVLQGGTLELPNGQRVNMAPGTTLMNPRDARHGAFRNVGDAPVRFFTVHVVDKGKPLYDFSR